MLLLSLGCAMNLSEMRSARVLRGGEVHVGQINSVVVPTASVRNAIDPAKTLIEELDEDELTPEERQVVLGGLSAVALTGPGYGSFIDAAVGLGRGWEAGGRFGNGNYSLQVRRKIPGLKAPWHSSASLRVGYGSGGAWFSVLDWANKAVKVSDLRRFDTSLSVSVGREFGEWGRLWWGPKAQVSPYLFELDGTAVGLGEESTRGTMVYAGGYVGGAVGYRWVHFAAELTVLHARGSVEAFDTEHDLSGLILAPHWGFQGTF